MLGSAGPASEFRDEGFAIARTMAAHARARGMTPGQLEAQWEDYLGALPYRFTDEDEALVAGLVVAGHASTPGYNDPAYPIEGRSARLG